MTALPVDVWLMVLEHVPDPNDIWSNIRNVSQYLRACVDEHCRHSLLRETVITLVYSTIHFSPMDFNILCVPMRFTHTSKDGTTAVFRQVQYTRPLPNADCATYGSVRGWVPFIERYCADTKKPAPEVLNKSKSSEDGPLWESLFPNVRDRPIFRRGPKTQYSRTLRDHASIGRGDRPPYLITINGCTHDTELFDLTLDCTTRTVSLDWRRTFAALFVERHFINFANKYTWANRAYDTALDDVEEKARLMVSRSDYLVQKGQGDNWRRARRKRLEPWVEANKKRMSPEHRLMSEQNLTRVARSLEEINTAPLDSVMRALPADYIDPKEIVPEKCASDHPDMMLWPASNEERKQAEKEVGGRWRKRRKRRKRPRYHICVIL